MMRSPIISTNARLARRFLESAVSHNPRRHLPSDCGTKQFVSICVPNMKSAVHRRLRHIGMGMPAPAVYPILRLGPF